MKLSPLKSNIPKSIPDKLIYLRRPNTLMHPTQQEFVMFSTKGDLNTGLMICHKTNMQLRDDYNGSSLAIDFITTKEQNKGMGRSLIEFAKKYSQRIGCNGFVHLRASCGFTPNRIPHTFYRKCGFSTLNKKDDALLDKFIKKNKNATFKDFPATLMFYPAVEYKKTFFEKLLDFFKFT